ncbi:MAG: hypothetical protein K0R99_1062 [Microbacterium sp.]|jgi:hypothetical protein|uniref:hypothetical protein n=1 Tax=Microbacterium sp. TaxID=51671 RepID=UPI002624D7E5|nr:hypothetical protein [Microbacterium sp.]MDF2559616.1 hypothetical protein [Microbacterium sp.]
MLALTETPMPTPSMTVDPVSVTPGFIGFAVIVVIVLAVILLIWDMNRRIRRVRYRDEVREELDAEEAARAAHDAPRADTPDADGSGAQDTDEEPPAR